MEIPPTLRVPGADTMDALKTFGAAVVVLLVFLLGYGTRDLTANSYIDELLKDHEIQLKQIETVKNKNSSLEKALREAGEERSVLLDEIASLKSRPPEIKYITRVETVVVGEETLVTKNLPESHTYKTEGGLPVAQFSVKKTDDDDYEYHFDTADLAISADAVIGAKDSAISLRITSDLEPDTEYEIPVDSFQVTKIKEQDLVEPHVLLGAHAAISPLGVKPGPHVGLSVFHLDNGLDLMHIKLGVTQDSLNLGLDPAAYNLGRHLPILTNTWVSAGVQVDTTGQIAGAISLGAKL